MGVLVSEKFCVTFLSKFLDNFKQIMNQILEHRQILEKEAGDKAEEEFKQNFRFNEEEEEEEGEEEEEKEEEKEQVKEEQKKEKEERKGHKEEEKTQETIAKEQSKRKNREKKKLSPEERRRIRLLKAKEKAIKEFFDKNDRDLQKFDFVVKDKDECIYKENSLQYFPASIIEQTTEIGTIYNDLRIYSESILEPDLKIPESSYFNELKDFSYPLKPENARETQADESNEHRGPKLMFCITMYQEEWSQILQTLAGCIRNI